MLLVLLNYQLAWLPSAGGEQVWQYLPNSSPMAKDKIDPAYLVQMQFQMHATGAETAYLVSWARTGVAAYSVPYSYDFVIKAAGVLELVYNSYVAPDDRPPLPTALNTMGDSFIDAWVPMYDALRTVVSTVQTVPQPPGAARLYPFMHVCIYRGSDFTTAIRGLTPA